MSLIKRFKFTLAKINNLPANPVDSKSTELEISDTAYVTDIKQDQNKQSLRPLYNEECYNN